MGWRRGRGLARLWPLSSRTLSFCVSPQLCDDKLCSTVFIPWHPAWPHHCPGPEPGQEHGGLPAVALGHPVGHEHQHRPGHQDQPLHRGPAGEDTSRGTLLQPLCGPLTTLPLLTPKSSAHMAEGRVLSTHNQELNAVVLRPPRELCSNCPKAKGLFHLSGERSPQNRGGREPWSVSGTPAESCVQGPTVAGQERGESAATLWRAAATLVRAQARCAGVSVFHGKSENGFYLKSPSF